MYLYIILCIVGYPTNKSSEFDTNMILHCIRLLCNYQFNTIFIVYSNVSIPILFGIDLV